MVEYKFKVNTSNLSLVETFEKSSMGDDIHASYYIDYFNTNIAIANNLYFCFDLC